MASPFTFADGRPLGDAQPEVPRMLTPLKRSREQVAKRISGDLARTSADSMTDAAEMDNLRSQKRFLSETMAADMSRMNCSDRSIPVASNPFSMSSGDAAADDQPGSPMATDRRLSSTSSMSSPQASDCFNPFGAAPVRTTPGRLPDATRRISGSSSVAGLREAQPAVGRESSASTAMLLSPTTPQRLLQHTPIDRSTEFMTPTPSRTRFFTRSNSGNGMDASEAERLPPSPSDPTLGQDLRRTALLRSLLQRTEEKAPAATPLHARHRPLHAASLETAYPSEQQRRQQKLAADLAASSNAADHTQHAQRGIMGPPPPQTAPLPSPALMGTSPNGMSSASMDFSAADASDADSSGLSDADVESDLPAWLHGVGRSGFGRSMSVNSGPSRAASGGIFAFSDDELERGMSRDSRRLSTDGGARGPLTLLPRRL